MDKNISKLEDIGITEASSNPACISVSFAHLNHMKCRVGIEDKQNYHEFPLICTKLSSSCKHGVDVYLHHLQCKHKFNIKNTI